MKERKISTDYFLGVNPESAPVFTWGYTGPDNAPEGQRQQNAWNFSLVAAEQALTLLIGELTGLVVDKEIFRGQVPTNVASGWQLALSQIPKQDVPDCRKFTAELEGRDVSRDAALQLESNLCARLPLSDWLTIKSKLLVTPVTLAELQLVEPPGMTFKRSSYRGQQAWNVALKLQSCWIVTPPRGLSK